LRIWLQVRILPGVPNKTTTRSVVFLFGRSAEIDRLEWYTSGMSKQNPDAVPLDFDGQRDGEQLLFVFRRHIIAMRKGFYALLIPFAVSSIPPLIWQTNLW